MSQLSKSLEKRIQELTSSIESQKTELAAYERVLHMETSKEDAPAESVPVTPEVASTVSTRKRAVKKSAKKVAKKTAAAPAKKVAGVAFSGNKTSLVADIVKNHGSAGATPKDVDAFFTSKNIKRSKNLIYNTLSYLVAQKKLRRVDGKYFVTGAGVSAAAGAVKKGAKKATKKAVKKTAAAPTKRKISPEGLKRIKDALKKRWAEKRAAQQEEVKP